MDVEMDPVVKKEWVEALRSGAYAQGKRALRPVIDVGYDDDGNFLTKATDTFCCLGVVCDLMAKKGLGVWLDATTDGVEFKYTGKIGRYSVDARTEERIGQGLLPGALACSIGLGERRQNMLARKNDDGLTFAELADLIEKEF